MKGLAGKIREILEGRRSITLKALVEKTGATTSQVVATLSYMEKRGELELTVEKTTKRVKNWKPVRHARIGRGEVANKVWKAMRYLKTFSANDLMKITGAKSGAIKNYIYRLRKKGYIIIAKKEKGQAFIYRIVKDQVKRPSIYWKVKDSK